MNFHCFQATIPVRIFGRLSEDLHGQKSVVNVGREFEEQSRSWFAE